MGITTVRERPILFSGEMVRAILEGRKTQTRRVVKPQPPDDYRSMVSACDNVGGWWFSDMPPKSGSFCVSEFNKWTNIYPRCPFGAPGDRLWVRETFYCDDYRYPDAPHDELLEVMEYRASHDCSNWEAGCPCHSTEGGGWTPSIHMPRWVSRITLEITDVRVERLQAISPGDLSAEGFPKDDSQPHDGVRLTFHGRKLCFAELWDRLNEKRGFSWDSNPWVWVIEFFVASLIQ